MKHIFEHHMHNERKIIHLNVADFAVAVERVCDIRLRQRPVVIAAAGSARAVVYDMSDEAYQNGVRKDMPIKRAQRLCRDAVILPPHPDRYKRAMQTLCKQVLPYAPLLEVVDDNGHLFMDVTGTHRLFGPAPDIGWRVGKEVRRSMNLAPIWTVAPNKLVAKVASRLVKPMGEYIVAAGEEASFLAPRPITLLPGLERVDILHLWDFNITKTGEMAALSLEQLAVPFGKKALHLYELARGIDSSPVQPQSATPPAVRFSHTFTDDTNEVRRVAGVVYWLAEQAGIALRDQRLAARRLTIFLHYTDGVHVVRQATTKRATANDFQLFDLARIALKRAWTRRVRLRHIHLLCDRLTFPPAQLELFPAVRHAREKREKTVTAIDLIRQRFGRESIKTGRRLAA